MGVTLQAAGDSWKPSVWYYQVRRTIARLDVTPLQIVGIYLVVGFVALYGSDVLLVRWVEDAATLSRLQTIKGGVEVLGTGGLIYILARRSRRSLRATNERLERQQEELQVLHRVLRHNLRNDVNLVAGYVDRLIDEVDSDRHRAWCEELRAVADRIAHYAEQTQKINRVTTDDTIKTIDLVAVVERVIDTNPEVSRAVIDDASLPDTAPVRAHPMLATAIDELLTNAVQHGDRDAPEVTVAIDPEAGPRHRTELVVSDDGPGVPDHVRRIVQQRGENQLVHLDGLGLWLVSWVVLVSDGRLDIEDRDPRGTHVRLSLPKATAGGPTVPGVSAIGGRSP